MRERLPVIPIQRRRLFLIFIGLLVNSIIFSASFSFFDSLNNFSTSYMGSDENIAVVFNPEATAIYTGTVPKFLADYLKGFEGVQSTSEEVLAQTITNGGNPVTIRGVNDDFFGLQELRVVGGDVEPPTSSQCLMGVNAYHRMRLNIGEKITLRSVLNNNYAEFNIQGVFSSNTPLDDEIIVPMDVARRLRGITDSQATVIRVKMDTSILDETKLSELVSRNYEINFHINSNSEEAWKTPFKITQNQANVHSGEMIVPGDNAILLPYGRYNLSIYGETTQVTVDQNKTIYISIPEKLYKITVNLFNVTSDSPVKEGNLFFYNIETHQNYSSTLNENGKAVAYLPEGFYNLTVLAHETYLEKNIEVKTDQEFTFSLGEIPLEIILLNENGNRYSSNVSLVGGDFFGVFPTDENGSLSLLLPNGEYNISTWINGKQVMDKIRASRRGTVILQEKKDLVKLVLSINWSNNTRISEASFSLSGSNLTLSGITDYFGEFIFYNLPQGAYTIDVAHGKSSKSMEVILSGEKNQTITLPSLINISSESLKPQWLRYLPQSITVKYAGEVFGEATRQIVSIVSSTVFILGIILSTVTSVNSIDITQNMVNETKVSIGILRSIGSTKKETSRILSSIIIGGSAIVGVFGYFFGYVIIAVLSKLGFLVLSGYTLVPRISLVILIASLAQSVVVSGIGLLRGLHEAYSYSIMSLLKGLSSKDVIKISIDYKLPLLAFLIPLLIRMVPEVIVWPLPIGYDTVSAYIPTLVALRTGYESMVYSFINQRPFFWLIYSLHYPFEEAMFYKFIPVLMHGLLGVSVYLYVKAVSGERIKALASALLATLYFVPLRVSWDLYGNEMGLVLLFIALMVVESGLEDNRNTILASLAVFGVIFTHEAASIMLLFSLIPKLLESFQLKKARKNWVLVFFIPLLFFIYRLRALDFPLFASALNSSRYPSSSYEELVFSNLIFYVYATLPLLPLAVYGAWRRKLVGPIKWMLIGTTIAALSPIMFPRHAIAFWTRWAYMSTYPLSIMAIEGLSKLYVKKIKLNADRDLSLGKIIGVFFILSMLFVSLGFLVGASYEKQPYQKLFNPESDWIVHHIPSSMSLSTISPEEANEAIQGLKWLSTHVQEDSVLLYDEEVRGFVWYYFNWQSQPIVDLGVPWYSNPNYIEDLYAKAEEYESRGFTVFFIGRRFYSNRMFTVVDGEYMQLYCFN